MNPPTRSLLRRLVLGQLLVIVLFCVLTSLHMLWQFTRTGGGEVDQSLMRATAIVFDIFQDEPGSREQLQQTSQVISQAFRFANTAQAEQQLAETSANTVLMRVFDASMQEIYRTPFLNGQPPDWLAIPAPTLGFADLELNSKQWREWRAYAARSKDGRFTVQILQARQSADMKLGTGLQKYLFMPLLLFLPIAAFFTWWSLRRGLSPLRELTRVIAARHPNDMRPLAVTAAYQETAPLVREINTLLEKLETTLTRERSFLADAAHELRTPLAVIQAQAHVLEHAQDAATAKAAAEELHGGVERTASLVQKLLLNARVSVEHFTPRFEQVDLSEFAQERIASLSILARRKSIDIELQAPPHCVAQIDRETFSSAFDNVLDNAIRYTPYGGEVRVVIAPQADKRISLQISDNGIGIAPELRPHVFERFFRIGGSDQQGSGLGLAIVKRVMALHGSDVSLSGGLDQRGLTVAFALNAA
jgi:signal transduction histidine kinase